MLNDSKTLSDDLRAALVARMGEALLEKRLAKEAKRDRRGTEWYAKFNLCIPCIRAALRATGLWRVGYRQYLDIQTTRNALEIAGLPAAFDGYRVLHLSDLHLELAPEDFVPAVCTALERVRGQYDLVAITGDISNTFSLALPAPSVCAMESLRTVLAHLDEKVPVVAVLGNHDHARDVPALEALGIRVLMNEHTRIERADGATLYVAGVDDPDSIGSHDLPRALAARGTNEACLLLAHSPAIAREAAQAGVGAVLAGHVHGGQFCLPGGVPVTSWHYRRIPRAVRAGLWKLGETAGFTSRGVGACAAPVRFHCPAEISVVTLRGK